MAKEAKRSRLQGAHRLPGTPAHGDARGLKTLQASVSTLSVLASEVFVVILKGNGNFARKTDVSLSRELLKTPRLPEPADRTQPSTHSQRRLHGKGSESSTDRAAQAP